MSPAHLSFRAPSSLPPPPSPPGEIGLGWIIVIAMSGGIIFFTFVGFVLSWRLKHRKQPYAARVYSYGRNGPTSAVKLSKRRLFGNEGEFVNSTSVIERSCSRSSWWRRDNTESVVRKPGSAGGRDVSNVRIPLSTPDNPTFAPIPTYQNFFFKKTNSRNEAGDEKKKRRRSRSWVDEDGLHGPEMKKHRRESWLAICRESWLGRLPTLPQMEDVENSAASKMLGLAGSTEQQYAEAAETLLTPKRESVESMKNMDSSELVERSGLEKEKEDAETQQRGRSWDFHHQTPNNDEGLRGILHLTEKRLKDGTSQSPTKRTPRSSPCKDSPSKSTITHKTVSSRGSTKAVIGTPSPSKRTPGAMSQTESIASVGSAANSLIAKATRELELLGGSQSPSRASGGHEWTQAPKSSYGSDRKQPSPEHVRSESSGSDVSSSLSTVYSANEPEDLNDVFVEKGDSMRRCTTTKSGYHYFPSPWSLGKRMQTQDLEKKFDGHFGSTLVPNPLRPLSRLRQPREDDLQDTKNEEQGGVGDTLMAASSESSMVTMSVHTADTEDEKNQRAMVSEIQEVGHFKEDEEELGVATPKPHYSQAAELSQHAASPSTPRRFRMSIDLSSFPLNEDEIVRLILLAQSGQRALPHPPSGGSTAVPSKRQSPEVASRPLANDTENNRSPSSSDESFYGDLLEDVASIMDKAAAGRREFSFGSETTTLSRGLSARSIKESNLAVGTTVAELRRMNSMISSQSYTSFSSTSTMVARAKGEMESHKSMHNLRSLGSSGHEHDPLESSSDQERTVLPMGSHFYLNISSPPKYQPNDPPGKTPAGPRPSSGNSKNFASHGHRRTRSIHEGKENKVLFGIGVAAPKIEVTSASTSPSSVAVPALRENRRSSEKLGREPFFRSGSPVKALSRLGSVKEEKVAETQPSTDGREDAGEGGNAKRRKREKSLGDADGRLNGGPKSCEKKSPEGKRGDRSLR